MQIHDEMPNHVTSVRMDGIAFVGRTLSYERCEFFG